VASDDGNLARPLGSVLDSDGNRVDILAAPDGTVVIEHVMGSVEIEPEWTAVLRELLDRAATPGQEPPAMSDEELRDELADAASAARASRDAREAWNDPDGEA
jgi:hypothetical protein